MFVLDAANNPLKVTSRESVKYACRVCANTTNLQQCSRCLSELYCRVVCQRQDWIHHKPECYEKCGGVSQVDSLCLDVAMVQGDICCGHYSNGFESSRQSQLCILKALHPIGQQEAWADVVLKHPSPASHRLFEGMTVWPPPALQCTLQLSVVWSMCWHLVIQHSSCGFADVQRAV